MQVIRREMPPVLVELVNTRGIGGLPGQHAGLSGQTIGLAQVAGGTGGHDVFPGRLATLRTGDHVVEGEILAGTTILAGESIAQEDIEPGEGRIT